MANEIKAGDTIGNFRVTSVTTLHEQGETATMLTHEPTGLRWLHFTADDPVSSCAIAIVTPVADDRGLPHVLEHMILNGSKSRPGTDLLRGMLNRTVVEELNATTGPFMTDFHFSSAVESDMRGLFEVWFDAILRPELSEATFLREAGRFLPQDASRPEGPLAYTGIVFNEMRGQKGSLSDQIIDEASRQLVPDNGFGFAHGGRPADIMSLTVDDVRAYHARWYRPANMRVVTRGRELPRELLALADRLLEGVEAGKAAPPFAPQLRWEVPRSAEIAVSAPESSRHTDKDVMPNQGILWLLPDMSDFRASLAMELFFKESAMNAAMNAAANRAMGKAVAESFNIASDQLGPDKVWGIYGFFKPEPDYPGETLWDRTARELRSILDNRETAAHIGSAAGALAARAVKGANEGLAEIARKEGFKAVFRNWIFRDDPFFGLDSSQCLATCHQFARDPGSAVAIVRNLLLEKPHRLDLSIREVKDGEDPESAAIALALAEKRNALTDEDCRALAAREGELAASLSAAPSGESLPETTLDDIPDDRLAIPCETKKATLCGTTLLTVKTPRGGMAFPAIKSNPSGEAWLAGFADLSDFTSEQLLMIPLIVKTFRERMRQGDDNLDIDCSSIDMDIGPYADTGLLDGVQRRGLKFMVRVGEENLKLVPKHFAALFQLRDPLSYEVARSMVIRATESVKVRQDDLRHWVWATRTTADESLIRACLTCRALKEVFVHRASCARLRTRQETGELAVGFVREASEVADMLHNPARWTFALAGPEHLTTPVRDALLATLLSAPARPIGPAAELKFAPKEPCEEEREAKSVHGCKVAPVSVLIPAPAHSALVRWRLELGARLLERDFVEPRIRRGLGAYGAKILWRDNVLRLESRQNPDVRYTLGLVRSLRNFVAHVEWTADDVRQAALAIASRFVNLGCDSTPAMVSRCLTDCIGGMTSARVRDGLKRIAETKPDSIRKTLLAALDAGAGHETVRVEASAEAIAEANSVLPEERRLHVMGTLA